MYTLYKFHFLNGISEINQLFDDILIIWPAPVWLTDAVPFITGSGSVPFLGISVKTTHSARTISAHITALRPQSPGCLITCHDRLCGSISLICSLKSSCVAVYSALKHWLCPSFRIHLFVPSLFKKSMQNNGKLPQSSDNSHVMWTFIFTLKNGSLQRNLWEIVLCLLWSEQLFRSKNILL